MVPGEKMNFHTRIGQDERLLELLPKGLVHVAGAKEAGRQAAEKRLPGLGQTLLNAPRPTKQHFARTLSQNHLLPAHGQTVAGRGRPAFPYKLSCNCRVCRPG